MYETSFEQKKGSGSVDLSHLEYDPKAAKNKITNIHLKKNSNTIRNSSNDYVDQLDAMTYSSQAGISKMFDSKMTNDSKLSMKQDRCKTAEISDIITKGSVNVLPINKQDPTKERTKKSFMAPED